MNDIISVSYLEFDIGRDTTGEGKLKHKTTNDKMRDSLYQEIDDDEYIPMTNEDIDAMFE